MRLLIIIVAAFAAVAIALAAFGGWFFGTQFYMRGDHAAVTAADMERRFSPEELTADLASMLAIMDRVHPNLYAYTPKHDIAARAEEIRASLTAPMTRMEFYRAIAPLNSSFVDGHTSLSIPAEEWRAFRDADGGVIPLDIIISGRRLFARTDISGAGIESGAEVLAINGVSAHDIASSMIEAESGESETYVESHLSGQFHKRYWSLYGAPAAFEILVAGAEGPVTVAAKPNAEATESLRGGKATSLPTLGYADGAAVLTVSSFDAPRGEFAKTLNGLFDEIQKSGAAALVIDIRNNGGGDSTYGDLLLSYLGDTKYEQIERVEIRSSAEVKAFYKTLLPGWAQWFDLSLLHPTFKGIYTTADGETFIYRFHEPRPYKSPRKNRFEGKVALIIGPRTYSSGAIFAAPFKRYGLATIVGEETGEPTVFYGDNYTFDLPATKLEATVSHKRFVTAGGVEDGRGVLPDIETPVEIQADGRDLALEAALAALGR